MKKNLLLLLLLSCVSYFVFAQNEIPTAIQISDGIAEEIKSFNIPAVPIKYTRHNNNYWKRKCTY